MFATLIRSALVAGCVMMAFCGGALAAERVALVIGNGNYKFANTLPNPANDATDITAKLKTFGFEVYGGSDMDKLGMETAVRQFAEQSAGAKAVLFFYAGHGMQVNGKNYLIPIDAKLESATSLDFETIEADKVIRYMTVEDRISIVLLDACRNNPLARSFAKKSRGGAVGTGLAAPGAIGGGGGILIGFATAPDDVAADGDGRNSPFTTALLKNFGTPGVDIEDTMKAVRRDVYTDTKKDQEPWMNSSLREDFYLVPASLKPDDEIKSDNGSGIPDLPKKTADDLFWEQIQGTTNAEVYRLFVKSFPDSPHVQDAQGRIAILEGALDNGKKDDNQPGKEDIVVPPVDNPSVDDNVVSVCPPESYRKLLMVTQLKQRKYLAMGFPTLDLTEGRIGCDAPALKEAFRQFQASINCPATGGLDEAQLSYLEGRSTTAPDCSGSDGDRKIVVVPADDTQQADAKAGFENLKLSSDELKRSYRALYRLQFLTSDRIDTDFTKPELVTAVSSFQSARGYKQTGYLTFEQVSYLVSLGSDPFPYEAAEAEETNWNFGGRDWITVYNQLAAYLSYRGIERNAGTVTRDDIMTIQLHAGMANSGYLSAALYDYVARQPKRFKARNFGAGAQFDDWEAIRTTTTTGSTSCMIKTDALSVEGQYALGETTYMSFSYDTAWNNSSLGISFGEAAWFDLNQKIYLVAKGQRTELQSDAGFLKPVLAKDKSVSTRAFLALAGASEVEITGTSVLGGELRLQYSAKGFKRALNDISSSCADNRLAVWLR